MTHEQDTKLVQIIKGAIMRRAGREALWQMSLMEIDLQAMAEEIAEQLVILEL